MKKKAISECTNCKITLDFKGMNERLRLSSADIKRNTKTPIWYWSGLGIIAILISIGFYYNAQHNEDVLKYIEEPLAGDVIEFKVYETGNYSTLRIESVTKDSIFVIQNDYEITKIGGLSSIDKDKNYTTLPYGLGRNQIQPLFDDDVFFNIKR